MPTFLGADSPGSWFQWSISTRLEQQSEKLHFWAKRYHRDEVGNFKSGWDLESASLLRMKETKSIIFFKRECFRATIGVNVSNFSAQSWHRSSGLNSHISPLICNNGTVLHAIIVLSVLLLNRFWSRFFSRGPERKLPVPWISNSTQVWQRSYSCWWIHVQNPRSVKMCSLSSLWFCWLRLEIK